MFYKNDDMPAMIPVSYHNYADLHVRSEMVSYTCTLHVVARNGDLELALATIGAAEIYA